VNPNDSKNRWWPWLLPSLILMPLSLFSASFSLFLPITLSAVAGILVSVGFSRVLAGEARWWAVLIVYLIFTLIIAFPLRRSGIIEAALIGDFIAMCILGCVIGIPIVNAYSRLGITAIVIACICVIGGSSWFALSNLLKPTYLQADFKLKGLDGDYYSLSQFMNKPTLLIYRCSITHTGCGSVIEMPYLESVYQKVKNKVNFVIVLPDGDDLLKAREYFKREKWSASPVLIDEGDAVYKQYGYPNMRPVHVLLDSSGVIKAMKGPGPFKNEADVLDWLKNELDLVKEETGL
jgi:peroxiredoxin